MSATRTASSRRPTAARHRSVPVIAFTAFVLSSCGAAAGGGYTQNLEDGAGTGQPHSTAVLVATTAATPASAGTNVREGSGTGSDSTVPADTGGSGGPGVDAPVVLPAPVSVPAAVTPPPQLSIPALPAPNETPDSGAAVPGGVLTLLAALPVADERRDGYDRDLFEHWVDEDGDGCDTRDEVLMAESLDAAQVDPYGCRVVAGRWYSAYDTFETADPGEVHIDHVVALAEAWDSGAWAWDAGRRRAFANDLDDMRSLVAVSAGSNTAKSDKDPADWLPQAGAVCAYLTDWVSIKARWSLNVDRREQRAIVAGLANCRDAGEAPVAVPTPVPIGAPVVISPAPDGDTVTAPQPPTGGDELDPMFPSCSAAKQAGFGPYRDGVDAEYAWYRDGDGDGVVCE